MATKWTSPTWRMPEESNQSKFENYSLSFDGATEKINFGDSDIFSFGDGSTDSPLSFSVWINLATLSTPHCVINKQTSSSNGEYKIYISTAGKIYIELANNGGEANGARGIQSGTNLSVDQWYHLAFTYDGRGGSSAYDGMNLYINGSLDSSTDWSYLSYTAMNNTNADLILGDLITGGSNTYDFQGKMGYFSIFDYALSQSQINYLYNSGTPQNPMAISGKAPIAYYPLGGGSTGDAAASSPSTLTVPNESVPSATVFNFNETQDISFAAANSGPLNDIGTGDFTVGIWANAVSNSNFRTLIGNWNTNGLIMWKKSSTNLFECYVGNDLFTTTYVIPFDNTWHHYLITRSGTDVTLYVDALSVLTGASSSSLASSSISYIGNQPHNSRKWKGQLSNAQIWNANLSDVEITTLYNYGSPLSGTQPQAANLKAWYKMGVDTSNWDGSNWIIGNSTANYSSALDFANNAKVSAGSITSLNNVSKASYSFWFYPTSSSGNIGFIGGQSPAITAYFFSNVFYIHNLGTGYISTSIPALNQWHHVCCTFDAGSTEAFLNGVSVGTNTNGSATTNPNGANDFEIGRANLYNFYFNSGQVSNVALFNSSLTSSQVQTLYNNGSPEASISHSPVAWWKLENTTITDSSGNGNTGTNVGATQVSSLVSTLNGTSSGMTTANLVNSDLTRSIPYSSYSLDFDYASSDAITLGNTIGNGFTQITCSAWVNLSTTELANNSRYRNFLVKFNGTALGPFELRGNYARGDSGNNKLFFRVATDTGSYGFTDTGFAFTEANRWYHIVGTYDGSSVKTFVDGIEKSSISANGTLVTNSDNATIGFDTSTGGFDGKISNASIFNTALTQDQILTIYNGGVPNDISSLSPVGWWSLSGDSYFNGNDFICPDLSSNSNNGTSSGMGGTELVGNGPGSTGNGIATGMNIPENLQGNAPNSTKNAFSINMAADDKTSSVPDISS